MAAEKQKNVDELLEQITIRGIRSSLLQSIETKKSQVNIVDAVSAEDIGKFPDKNVAESLQRITGISLDRVMGEGERVGVRGTAPSQNLVFLNGQNIASSDWWITSQPSRGFNFTLLPSEIVSSLEVYKSPEADLDEGSLGGAIIVNTHKPLETEKNQLVASMQLQYSDVSQQWDPHLSAMYNWRNEQDDFGILLSVVRRERNLRRDGIESWGWTERNFNQLDNGNWVETKQADADLPQIWAPNGGGSAVFQQQRVLTNGLVSAQWQPNRDAELTFNGLWSVLEADNSNQNFLWMPVNSYNNQGEITNLIIDNQALSQASFAPLPEQAFNTSMEAIWRESEIDTQSWQVIYKQYWRYWQAELQLGHTMSEGGTDRDNTSQWSANTPYSVDLSDIGDVATQYQVSPVAAEDWFITEARLDAINSSEQEDYFQLDLTRSLDHIVFSDLSFGIKYRDHGRDLLRSRSRNGGLDQIAADLDWTLADYQASFPKNFMSGIGSNRTLKRYAYADTDKLNQAFSQLPFVISEEKESKFDVTERTYAGYIKLDLAGQDYRGNFGLRVVQTRQLSAGFQQQDSLQPEPNFVWTDAEKSYTDLLPSLNFSVDLSAELVGRFAVARVMARPDYDHIMPSVNYNKTQATGTAGNPELDPFRADQFDIGVEYYWQEASMLSVVGFYKDVQSFIDISRSIERFENIEMTIDRPVNGPGGRISGLELGLQHEFIYGLGMVANYTYVDGDRTASNAATSDIPGNSKHTFNLTGYYEDDIYSARLSYNYRTRYATGVGEEITDSYGQLDMNLSYTLNEQWRLLLEGINLNDEKVFTYDRIKNAPVNLYRNGRRIYLGVRFEY